MSMCSAVVIPPLEITTESFFTRDMIDFSQTLFLTLLAGLAMPLGAVLAAANKFFPAWLDTEIRHGVIAFGGGALFSAVALVLVPEGVENLTITGVCFWFLLGGLCFLLLDLFLYRHKAPMSQLVAMMSDFIPEALALGAAIAAGGEQAVLLAGLMALQNLPEGFNASRELRASTRLKDRHIISAFVLLALFGPVCGAIGFYYLIGFPVVVSAIMVFAAGGILYVVFGDIAPQAKLENHWLTPMGAVAGFLLGVIGQMLIN